MASGLSCLPVWTMRSENKAAKAGARLAKVPTRSRTGTIGSLRAGSVPMYLLSMERKGARLTRNKSCGFWCFSSPGSTIHKTPPAKYRSLATFGEKHEGLASRATRAGLEDPGLPDRRGVALRPGFLLRFVYFLPRGLALQDDLAPNSDNEVEEDDGILELDDLEDVILTHVRGAGSKGAAGDDGQESEEEKPSTTLNDLTMDMFHRFNAIWRAPDRLSKADPAATKVYTEMQATLLVRDHALAQQAAKTSARKGEKGQNTHRTPRILKVPSAPCRRLPSRSWRNSCRATACAKARTTSSASSWSWWWTGSWWSWA